MDSGPVRILIVDDSRQDVLLIRKYLAASTSPVFQTDWAPTYSEGLAQMLRNAHDLCIVDQYLDERDGLDLMRTALEGGCKSALIMVTGASESALEMSALQVGASDYLVKGRYDADMLQRVIRHVLYRSHVEHELRLARDTLERRVQARTTELREAVAALQQEIEHREQTERHLRETEDRFRIIFEEAMDAIILIAPPTGAFVEFNNQACRQLGYDRAEFQRLTLKDIEAREPSADIGSHLQRILTEGADVFETLHRTRTGEVRNILVSARPLQLNGTPFVLSIFHDFTERKQIEDKLRAAVIRLEQHNMAKSDFVANVSHELKTPLTSMMYGVRNLLKGVAGPLPDHAVRYLKLFDTECQRLVGTINDILDLGKLENHALTLAAVTTPLALLINRCVESLRPQADAAGISIVAEPVKEAPFVRSDPNMVQRVLQNIIGNAIKFTPRGGTIRLTAHRENTDGSFARITVTDSGIGIPKEALHRVTERYFRANNRTSGSGLGLAISKDIMHLHGGSLSVASPPPGQPQGTEVSITLPLAESPTVLVGDDDTAIQDLLKIHLSSHGYRVITADSGQEVILTAEASHPDLILLDLIMEDIHGTTVILSLRGSPHIRYIPIIAITGATLDEGTADILARFSVPTLPKPWKTTELLDTIDTALMGMTAFQSSSNPEMKT